MKRLDIHARMLLAALLPLGLVSTLLAGWFLMARFEDMQESYQQRIRSVARQISLASEYGLFSVNQVQLQALTQGAMREPDVRYVAVLDVQGNILASAGDLSGKKVLVVGPQEFLKFDRPRRVDILGQPVFATGIDIDDPFLENAPRNDGLPTQLGQVVIEFSRHSVDERKRQMLKISGGIGVVGLVFGMLLAMYLSRGVMRPIMRVTHLIERIGKGDFAVEKEISEALDGADPLHGLQRNLQQMAFRLAWARQDLETQVALATQALREKKDEAERANQAKSRFLAAASHDLRQPIHALGMFVTRLAQLPHDAQTHQLIGNLEASVRAMQNLLDGLLDISRLDAQAVQVKRRPFPVSHLFSQLMQDLSQTALDRGLSMRIRPSDLWVLSDATLVYRMLLNLVSNALRYTDRGGVLVAARSILGGTHVSLEVWDTGIGIAEEHQNAVFTEFFQVANAARDRAKGLGLGLNICQRTADLLGHPLKLTSRLHHGTRFTLVLPVVKALADDGAQQAADPVIADDFSGAMALVIEDDVLVRSALVGLLEGWGLRVVEAQGMAQARQKVLSGAVPQLIISDYRLPDGMDGIAGVRMLRTLLGSRVPACLMSGDTDPDLMHAAQDANLTLLHKPVRPAKLRSLLRRLLHPNG